MECKESIARLSDLHDGFLSDGDRVLVLEHLSICPPCNKVYYELKIIVSSAKKLDEDTDFSFPDRTVIWQRLTFTNSSKY